MEQIIKLSNDQPEWAKTRGSMVRFIMDFYAKGGKRRLAEKGDTAFVLSNYIRDDRTITVQPMDRYYCIHNAPIDILESCGNTIKDLV